MSASLSEPGQTAIQISGLVKYFGQHTAVAGISLDVPRGTFFGLLGPNGAGKSTTLGMVTGLLRPNAGEISVLGIDAIRNPVELKQRIGIVPETLLLFERLTGPELLEYIGLLRGLERAQIRNRSEELLAVLGLEEHSKLVIDYSQGMRKKISLAAALIHGPELLLLDEPFESVDPVSVRTIKQVLGDYVESGATVVFSSHVMETVEDLCDHIAIMDRGYLVASGDLETVRSGRRLEEVFAEAVGAAEVDSETLAWLREGHS